MVIIETCPKCGHDLFDSVLYTNPPIPKKECLNCGWTWEGEPDQVIRVPFVGNIVDTIRECPVQPSDAGFEASACRYCSNHPANGGSGICYCILGQQGMVTY